MTQEMDFAIAIIGTILGWVLIVFFSVKIIDYKSKIRSRRMDAEIKLMYADFVAEVKQIFGEMDRVLGLCSEVTLSDVSDDELAQMFLKTFYAGSNDAGMKLLVRAWVNDKGYLK